MVGGVLLINVDQSLCTLFLLLNFRPFVSTTKNLLISPLTSLSDSPIVVIFSFSRTLISWRRSSLAVILSNMASSRWIRPEVFPLFASVGVAVGICAMQLVRNISSNPDVRVTKENRAAGVLDNFKEGEKYAEHGLRKFVRNKTPQIMPSINGFFSDPDLPSK